MNAARLHLDERLTLIRSTISETKRRSPVAARSITVLGACKGQSARTIEEAIGCGITDFGENRVQEAQSKWPEIKKHYPNIRLHLIGPLQTNKVEEALVLFDVIQTLDREKLAKEIAAHPLSATKHYYVQVNTGEELQKNGVAPIESDDFIAYCRKDLLLPVVGLMCVPPADQPPAPHFALLRQIAEKHELSELSMGMSNDFEAAVRMGSTCVRIGTALFGERGPALVAGSGNH